MMITHLEQMNKDGSDRNASFLVKKATEST